MQRSTRSCDSEFNVDRTANSVLRTTAPETTRIPKGLPSFVFLCWFFAVSSAVFDKLFWYFFTQNCSLRSEIVPNSPEYNLYVSYGTGRNYLCNTKIASTDEMSTHTSTWFTASKNPDRLAVFPEDTVDDPTFQVYPPTAPTMAPNKIGIYGTNKGTDYCLLGNFKASNYRTFR